MKKYETKTSDTHLFIKGDYNEIKRYSFEDIIKLVDTHGLPYPPKEMPTMDVSGTVGDDIHITKIAGMTIKDVARHKDVVKLEKRIEHLENAITTLIDFDETTLNVIKKGIEEVDGRIDDLEWTVGKLKEIIHHSDISIDTRKVSLKREDD